MISPLSGMKMPFSILSSVLLPDPLAPIMPSVSPLWTSNEILSTALNSSLRRLLESTEIPQHAPADVVEPVFHQALEIAAELLGDAGGFDDDVVVVGHEITEPLL